MDAFAIVQVYAENRDAVDALWETMPEETTLREAVTEWLRRCGEQGDTGNYESLERSIRRAPPTWLPGLLTAAMKAAWNGSCEVSVAKEVFIENAVNGPRKPNRKESTMSECNRTTWYTFEEWIAEYDSIALIWGYKSPSGAGHCADTGIEHYRDAWERGDTPAAAFLEMLSYGEQEADDEV